MSKKFQKPAKLKLSKDMEEWTIDVAHQKTILKAGALQNAIFNSANFSCIATDAKGVIQIFNVGAERMLGYAATEVLNKVTPADISDPKEVIARAKVLSLELATTITPGFEALVFKASRGIEDIYELTYLCKDGSRLPAVVSVTALRDAQNSIIGYLLIGTDNTARKLAEEALHQAGALQNAIFNSANFSSIATDAKGVIQIFNVGAERMLGYAAEEVLNKFTPADLSDPQELIERATSLSQELETTITQGFDALVYKSTRRIEDIYDLTYIRKDGSRFPAVVSVTALRDAQNSIIGYLLIGTDNTARKLAEETICKISTAVEQSPVSVVITDTNGSIEYVNPFFLETTGYSLPEVIGQNPRILKSGIFPPEGYKDLWGTLMAGEIWRGEFHNKKKNGEIFWEQASISPIRNAHGVVTSFVAVKEDITERKHVEEALGKVNERLQRVHALEALGVLVAGVAHNINNVLAVIMGTASMQEELATEKADREAYGTIGTACMRGRSVIKSLLQFAQPILSKPIPFELHSVIREVRSLLEGTTRNRIKIVETFARGALWIIGDAGSINHALMNLCINSLGAMPDGGTLTLRTAALKDNWVEVTVEDSGSGMTSEVLAHVMEPFYTTKEVGKGTGLGLSMTYGVIIAHGGTIDIASQQGKGTIVTLRFPRIPPPVQSEPVNTTAPCLESMSAILVDDDEDVNFLMGRMLKQAGLRKVKTFSGGEEVLESLRSGECPDLIILDQNMPGMNGTQTMERIRDLYPDVPILISSGQPDIEEWECFKRSNVGVISKPFNMQEIMGKLAQFAHETIPGLDGPGGIGEIF